MLQAGSTEPDCSGLLMLAQPSSCLNGLDDPPLVFISLPNCSLTSYTLSLVVNCR